jgi:hypothetical protein
MAETSPATSSDVRALYAERRAQRRERADALARTTRILSNARLAVFAVGIALAWLALWKQLVSGFWLAPLALGFIALVLRHDRERRALLHAERGALFYSRGLARLELDAKSDWGNTGERYSHPEHSYATHLDLFGPGSLFSLLSQAQTEKGEEYLARWLLGAAPPGEVRARQAAARELRPRLALREDWFALGPEAREGLRPESLVKWATAPARLGDRALRIGVAVLSSATLTAVIAALVRGRGGLWVAVLFGLQAVAWNFLRARVSAVLEEISARTRDLEHLSVLLALVEAERFESPRLRALRAALDTDESPPSRQIKELHRLVAILDWRRNQFFAPIALMLMWGVNLAFALEAWRARCGAGVARWLESLGELEALADLANYSFEHPEDPFPEISDSGPRFHAQGLGHPLIDESRCVRNDLSLDPDHALVVVSGSNMSGKSTFLRSVGTGVVMALAGAPVRARSLQVSPLALGAVLRVQDSLRDGASRFYAELLALRRVVERCREPLPVLFLLDEILNGTNSHDRRIGAEALLRGLLARGAVGLVTTHDLALTAIADELAPRAKNAHFEDQLQNGALHFDYRLRDGVIARGNALALMRAVGLDFAEPAG